MTEEEIEFAFNYGVFLQLVDDLQDVNEDLKAGSETLFTQAATKGKLDALTNRLLWYLQQFLRTTSLLNSSQAGALTELICQGGAAIILESIALNPGMFSGGYTTMAEKFSPLRFEAIRNMHAKRVSLERRFAAGDDPRPGALTLSKVLQMA